IYQQYVDMEAQPVGRMVTRVTNDTDAIKDLYTDVLVSFAGDCLVLGGIIVVMLCIDWQLALVSFTVIPVMVIFSIVYQKYARQAYRLVRERTANVNSFLQENMNGISVIKAFARFRRSEMEFADVSVAYLKAGIKEIRTFAIFRPLVDLIYMLAVVLVLWYGGWQNRYGGMEIGVIVAFLSYVEKLFMPIKDLAEKYNLLQSALAAAERVYDMLVGEQPAEEKLVANSSEYFLGNITFENIWFAYEEPYWVLQDVSFAIKAGEFVGIVGLSGSGKSTIISLLLRFYQPQQGRILLDGVDIRDIPLAVLRRTVGVVFQDVHLFKGTIAENISMYDLSMAHETIVAAAETANAHEFIMKLPEAYAGNVGYQGALLSVGQRQLVSLARALACQADVLVLDEATSSIDSETERLIQGALENIVAERTMLVVAHRLSTIQYADNIVVLHHGRVVEQGTHLELLTYQNIYYQLHNSQ
ncbi:MAG TPA: ABC transporter ATP-binding protein, partial [Negativicutes bacterium]